MSLLSKTGIGRSSVCERGKRCSECKGDLVKFYTGDFYLGDEGKLVFKICWKCRCGSAYYSEDGGRDAPPRLKRAAKLVLK